MASPPAAWAKSTRAQRERAAEARRAKPVALEERRRDDPAEEREVRDGRQDEQLRQERHRQEHEHAERRRRRATRAAVGRAPLTSTIATMYDAVRSSAPSRIVTSTPPPRIDVGSW